MKVGSLFSGIGGLELGLLMGLGGGETVFQVERDPYALAVLAKHWPDTARYTDVRTVTGAALPRIDLLCGGFPCQPHSVAGKREGSADERDLWPEFARLVGETRPRWMVAENVPGLLSNDDLAFQRYHRGAFFGRVLRDLAALGYDAEWHCFPATSVGAQHIRERVFIVAYAGRSGWSAAEPDLQAWESHPAGPGALAYTDGQGRHRGGAQLEQAGRGESANRGTDVAHSSELLGDGRANHPGSDLESGPAVQQSGNGGRPAALADAHGEGLRGREYERSPEAAHADPAQRSEDVAHSDRSGREEQHPAALPGRQGQRSGRGDAPDWAGGSWRQPSPVTFSAVRGMADGFPGRVGRLRTLGNAVVPQQAAVIGRAIKEAEAHLARFGVMPEQIVRPCHFHSTP